ncbi:MAG: FAD-dependent oxidoreductase, partial [Acidimicrobiia bacterium]|nr:FAD-dependent oxidoreductase [Acidimicrobiia bacterium]
MKKLLVLGAGTAGTMVVNKLRPRLPQSEWSITVVDPNPDHHYQPGYLFLPFGIYEPKDLVKPKRDFIPPGVEYVAGEIDLVEADQQQVVLTDGSKLDYDYLVIATGTSPRPDQTPGLDGPEYGESIHDFYTLEGATRLRDKLRTWGGGRLVVQVVEMPIKCPVAPLEFSFLADWHFTEAGIRDQVEMVYVTPLPGAFTKPVAARHLGHMLDERKIALESD